jgi:hypothetical protein
MADAPQRITTHADALAVAERYQEAMLRKSPLAGMAEWVASGRPPSAEQLRSQDFTTAGPAATEAGSLKRLELGMARKAFVRAWGFSIPCAEAVAALRELGPLVELGAGTGYWAVLLRRAGVDVVATDPHPEGRNRYGFDGGVHYPSEALDAVSAVRAYADRDLFCSWPSEAESWALGAAWALRPGRRIALILNPQNTGTAGLRRYLATRFRKLAAVTIPQFPGCQDELTIHQKL